MSDAKRLIEQLAAHIEAGETVDFAKVVDLHDKIKTLYRSVDSSPGQKEKSARAVKEADMLLEKIILEYVASTSVALQDLGRIVGSLSE